MKSDALLEATILALQGKLLKEGNPSNLKNLKIKIKIFIMNHQKVIMSIFLLIINYQVMIIKELFKIKKEINIKYQLRYKKKIQDLLLVVLITFMLLYFMIIMKSV